MNARGEYGNQGRTHFIGANHLSPPPHPHQEPTKMTSIAVVGVAAGVVGLGILWLRKYKALMRREIRAITPGPMTSKYPDLVAALEAQKAKTLNRLG
jgi:hypothetical protein